METDHRCYRPTSFQEAVDIARLVLNAYHDALHHGNVEGCASDLCSDTLARLSTLPAPVRRCHCDEESAPYRSEGKRVE